MSKDDLYKEMRFVLVGSKTSNIDIYSNFFLTIHTLGREEFRATEGEDLCVIISLKETSCEDEGAPLSTSQHRHITNMRDESLKIF
jgi:hypothetical protein